MIRIRAERGWSFDGFQMWFIRDQNNRTYIAKPFKLEFVEIDATQLLPEPSFRCTGQIACEMVPALRKALAGMSWFEDKEDYEASKRIEKAMQAHIDSLKLVVDRVICIQAADRAK